MYIFQFLLYSFYQISQIIPKSSKRLFLHIRENMCSLLLLFFFFLNSFRLKWTSIRGKLECNAVQIWRDKMEAESRLMSCRIRSNDRGSIERSSFHSRPQSSSINRDCKKKQGPGSAIDSSHPF